MSNFEPNPGLPSLTEVAERRYAKGNPGDPAIPPEYRVPQRGDSPAPTTPASQLRYALVDLSAANNGQAVTVDSTKPTGFGLSSPSSGGGLPAGGTTGQVLRKTGSADGQAGWGQVDGSMLVAGSVAQDRLARTLRRAAVVGGAVGVSKITNQVPDFCPRNTFYFPFGTTRWRYRARNFMSANASPFGAGSGVFDLSGVGLGDPLYPAATNTSTPSRWAGKGVAAFTQALPAQSAALPDGLTTYTSAWVTDPALQAPPGSFKSFTAGWSTTSATWSYGGDASGAYCYQASGAAAAFLQAAPALAGAGITAIDWWIEYECLTPWGTIVAVTVGDSNTLGAPGTDGGTLPHESTPGVAGLLANALVINAGVSGSTAANWATPGYKLDKFEFANMVPDVVFMALGSPNDAFATNSPVAVTAVMDYFKTFGVKRFGLGTSMPNNYAPGSAPETQRQAYDKWVRGRPFGIEHVADFDRVISKPGQTVVTSATLTSGAGGNPITVAETGAAAGIQKGAAVAGTVGIAQGTTVTDISGTTVTLNTPPIASGATVLTFTNQATVADPALMPGFPHPDRGGHSRRGAELAPFFARRP